MQAGSSDRDRVDFPGLGTTYLVRSEDTDGRFALVEHDIPPRKLAAPMHRHEHEDEYSYVLEGQVGVQIGDDVRVAGPGEFVPKPRGIWHAFWNAGDETARLLELISPGGFERYFAELEPHISREGGPDLEQMGVVRARYALEMDVESIARLMEEHNLRP
jgi:quercetin dioxygenase-like cupin family protein